MPPELTKTFEGQNIRILGTPEEPLFVAVDVCSILGLTNSREVLKSLDDDEAGVSLTDTRSENGVIQSRELSVVTESGLYHLIFKSRKPAAKTFRRWITRDVLPSLRKTGTYSMAGQSSTLEDRLRRLESQYPAPSLTPEDALKLQTSLKFFAALITLGTGYELRITLTERVSHHFADAYRYIKYAIPTAHNPAFDILNPAYTILSPDITTHLPR